MGPEALQKKIHEESEAFKKTYDVVVDKVLYICTPNLLYCISLLFWLCNFIPKRNKKCFGQF